MVLTSIAHFFTHLFMLVYPTIAVVQAHQWGVDVADLLVYVLPGFVLYGLMAMPFGVWADRSPGSLPLAVGLIGMAGGSTICALADTGWQIGAGLGVIGIFASAYHPAGLGLIAHGVSRRSWALGVNGSFGSAAVAFAPGLAEILSEGLGWRYAFGLLAAPALVVGLVFLLMPIRVAVREEAPDAAETAGPTTLRTPSFLTLCVCMTLGGLAYRGATVVLPALYDQRVDFLGHGVATSVTYGLAIVMNYVGGRLAERFRSAPVYLALHAISLPALFATAWLSGLPLLLIAAVYAGCALGTQPAENTLVAQLSPPSRRGLAYGVKFTLTFGVGAAVVPVVAAIMKTGSMTPVMLLLAGIVALLVVTAAVLVRRIRA